MRRRVLSLILTIAMASPAFAKSAGTTAAPILQMGAGARGLGMGGAYAAVAEGADSLFWNPAGLASGDDVDLTLNHQPLLKVMTYDGGAVAFPARGSRFAFGYAQLRSDSFQGFDASGNGIGTFSSKDQVATLGGAHDWDGWQGGLSGRWIHSSLAGTSASAWAMGAGVTAPGYWHNRIRHALVIQNVGSQLKYDEKGERLPTQATFGTLFTPSERLKIDADLIESHNGADAAAGAEYALPLGSDRWAAFLRAGYSTAHRDVGSGMSIGGGLALSGVRLDFAWMPEADFGSSEVFTLSYGFGSSERASTSAEAPVRKKESETAARPAPVPTPAARPRAVYQQTPDAPYVSRRARVYEVKPGDTLAKIAERFYGDRRLWRTIYTANRVNLGDSTRLEVGQKIIVPQQ